MIPGLRTFQKNPGKRAWPWDVSGIIGNQAMTVFLLLAVISLLMPATANAFAKSSAVTKPDRIQIPPPENATLDSREDDQIDYVADAGKGRATVRAWLDKFRSAGWQVEVNDESAEDGDYELTKGGWSLEIEFDDPGFGPADLSVSCDGKHVLVLTTDKETDAPKGPPTQSNSGPGANKPPSKPVLPASPPRSERQTNSFRSTLSGRDVRQTTLGEVDQTLFEQEGFSFWASAGGHHIAWLIEKGICIDGVSYTFDRGIKEDSLTFGANGKRHAFVAQTSQGETVFVDGVEVGSYHHVKLPICFTDDGSHVAWFANIYIGGDSQPHLVIDGDPGQPIGSPAWEFVFTNNGRSILYGVEQNDRYVMCDQPVDRSQPAKFLDHGPAKLVDNFFTGPGGRVGYIAKFPDDKFAMVYDGVVGKMRFEELDFKNLVVAPENGSFAYVGKGERDSDIPVHNGIPGSAYSWFDGREIVDETMSISFDGRRIAFVMKHKRRQALVIDGVPGKEYEEALGVRFSKDGSRYAHLAYVNGAPLAVVDGKESPVYEEVGRPIFSENNQTVAWFAAAKGRQFVVVNGKPQESFDEVQPPVISKDGSIVAYIATEKDQDFVIVNGKRSRGFVVAKDVQIPEGREAVRFLAVDGEKVVLMENDQELERMDTVHVGPVAAPGGEPWVLVGGNGGKDIVSVSGKRGEPYGWIFGPNEETDIFLDNRRIHYFAVLEGKLLYVEETIN